jgi:hypothetical protein
LNRFINHQVAGSRHGGAGVQKEKRLLFTAITIAKFISLKNLSSPKNVHSRGEPLQPKI